MTAPRMCATEHLGRRSAGGTIEIIAIYLRYLQKIIRLEPLARLSELHAIIHGRNRIQLNLQLIIAQRHARLVSTRQTY